MSRVFNDDIDNRMKKFLDTINAEKDAKTIVYDPQDMDSSIVPLAGKLIDPNYDSIDP